MQQVLQVATAFAFVFIVDEVGFGFGFIWFCWSAPVAAVCYFEILVEWLVCGEMHVATPPFSRPRPLSPCFRNTQLFLHPHRPSGFPPSDTLSRFKPRSSCYSVGDGFASTLSAILHFNGN